MTWPDFDSVRGTLAIRHQLLYAKGRGVYLQTGAKTTAGQRSIRLPESIVAMLIEHRREQLKVRAELGDEWRGWDFEGSPVPLIFSQANGRPIGSRADTNAWHQLLAAVGLPEVRRYQSRHTAATHMIVDSGGDVAVTAKYLGHSDAGFTYRTYVHPLEEREAALAEQMDAPYSAPYEASIERQTATPTAREV